MSNVTTVKSKGKVVKLHTKKSLIHKRNRAIITLVSTIFLLFIIITSIKNIYISYKCTDFLYAVDYCFTNYKDKNFRLINVKSMSVLGKVNENIEVEAIGYSYKKPYDQKTLRGIFSKNTSGKWSLKSVSIVDKKDYSKENHSAFIDKVISN